MTTDLAKAYELVIADLADTATPEPTLWLLTQRYFTIKEGN